MAQASERFAGPRTRIHLDQLLALLEPQTLPGREWLDRLYAPFQRARVQGRELHPVESSRQTVGLCVATMVQGYAAGSTVERGAGLSGEAVADEEDCGHEPGAYAGNRTSNVLPDPSSLSTLTLPPRFSAMCFTMAKPSPVPPVSRERARSMR